MTTFKPYNPEEMLEEGGEDLSADDKLENEKMFKYITCGDLSAYDELDEHDGADEQQ